MSNSTMDARSPMHEAVPLVGDAETAGRPTVAGIVEVVTVRARRRPRQLQARCTCGWTGRRRWVMAPATVEALTHAYENGCVPRFPLNVGTTLPTAGAR